MDRQWCSGSSRSLPVVVAVLVLFGLVLGRAPAAHADPVSFAACAAQQAQLDGMEAKRLAHNAQPHPFLLPQQRKGNPSRNVDATFQGKPKPAVGDADPAYPGRTIRSVNGRPDVSADHIVPLSDLVNLPGFARLSPENMWLLSRSPVNFQWMSRTANESKNSGLAGRITGADPGWMAQQDALQMQTRQKLIDLIKQLNGES